MKEILSKEFHRRLIEEGFARIEKCCGILSEDEIWSSRNANTNSVGNLILHLTGNVRQYIQTGIDGQADVRERDLEFDVNSRVDSKEVLGKLKKVITEAHQIVSNLSEEELTEKRTVQGFSETVLSIIIHVIEHFSYHVGQITFYTKYLKDVDTGYYDGLDLNATAE